MLMGIFNLLLGSFFVWIGAFQLITAMMPHDMAMKAARAHGEWCRESLFKLPPIGKEPK